MMRPERKLKSKPPSAKKILLSGNNASFFKACKAFLASLAELVAQLDVYDALRSKRVYKLALSHTENMRIMVEGKPGHFDPALLAVLRQCAPHFNRPRQ
jgi:hypothetical protein